MRKILITAAALTLGTSAYAWQPSTEVGVTKPAMAKLATDSVKTAWQTEMDAKTELAAYGSATSAALDVDTAGYPTAKGSAVGGPEEASADMWPACRPGPGDDRCIQLYERGVLPALAALKSESNVAMGGPLEPAPEGDKAEGSADDHAAMGHGSGKDSAKTETPMSEAEIQANMAAKQGAVTTPAPSTSTGGIGGPVEARTGYPACSATVTDSCIQLHERGVTGQGN